MTFVAFGLCVALVAFGALSALLSLALRPIVGRAAAGSWSSEALLGLRFVPTLGAALAVAGLLVPAFLRFEPRDGHEQIEWGLAIAAAATLLVLGAGVVRGALALRASRRLRDTLARGAKPIVLAGAPAPAF